ncbi:FUSC family protein [Xanthobacter autotrophicus]|uniref:FUSC family protein n=1 Tax=Xanthobacter TaxID=279 RepID=UPI0024ABBD42|nr:FUSC family protein [Xanthobacter autotrophicus]MDI4666517.1 FUSC family protein [Xanthobacter autotrophicus]
MPSPDPGPALPSFLERLSGLLGPSHFKLGLRAALAGLVAYGLATGLALPNGYWAVLTAVLVVQATIGASLAVAIDRALGTVVGGVVGVAAAMLAGNSAVLTYAALGIAVFLTATLSARSASYKLAPVTVVIVLLADPSHVEPWLSGLHRVFEIAVGGVVGMASSILILPERALLRLFPHCAKALRLNARLLELGRDGLVGRGLDPGDLDRLNAEARVALRAADARISEALTEQVGGLVGQADPAPVVRSCRRLWHSVIILLRGADRPMDKDVAQRVAPSLDAAVAALSASMHALADRLDGQEVAGLDEKAQAARAAVAALEAEAERLNGEGVLETAGADTLTSLFAAVSACNHVRENLEDLAARFEEVETDR